MSNPYEWRIVQCRDGFYIEDEYGENIENRCWSSFKDATEYLDKIVLDEITAMAEAAFERQQEYLMETGGGPTLQEQQQAAYKIKHGQ